MILCSSVSAKKVELLTKVYDHAKKVYCNGFCMLTLGWSDGTTFLPVNSILLSSEKKNKRRNEAVRIDKRTSAMLELLNAAKARKIPASYVLFDSWFFSSSTLHVVKEIGYDVIGMVKKSQRCILDIRLKICLFLRFISGIKSVVENSNIYFP